MTDGAKETKDTSDLPFPVHGSLSVDEAAETLLQLEKEVYEIFSSIRKKKKQLIRVRFQQGALVDHVIGNAKRGDGKVAKLSEKTGISDAVLYDAKRFFELPQFGRSLARLNQWLTEQEERKGTVTWSYCREIVRRRVDPRRDPEHEVRWQRKKLEQRARRLESDAEDLERQVEEMTDPDEQSIGVAEQARRVAEDIRRQAGRLDPSGPKRITDENYLAFLRTQPCCVSGQTPAEPHHLIPVGRGGPDYSAIPLIRRLHDEAQGRRAAFEQEHGVNLWKECNLQLIKYIVQYETD